MPRRAAHGSARHSAGSRSIPSSTSARTAHPDTGGDPVRFHAVQRAWSLVGTPEARAAFDRGVRGPVSAPTREAWAPAAPSRPRDSRPLARSYGHPGGLTRELYLARMR